MRPPFSSLTISSLPSILSTEVLSISAGIAALFGAMDYFNSSMVLEFVKDNLYFSYHRNQKLAGWGRGERKF